MTDRVYIHPLREGSDDCWDDGAGTHVLWEGCAWWTAMRPTKTRPCAVWTGTADREVLDSLARGE